MATSYAEQQELVTIDNTVSKDWITDKGNYYLVVVPSYKLLKNESFDKPVLFILQEGAMVDSVCVDGFTTVVCERGGHFLNSYIDCKETLLTKPRSAVLIDKTSNRLVYHGNIVQAGPSTSHVLEVPATGNHLIDNCDFRLYAGMDAVASRAIIAAGYELPVEREYCQIYVYGIDVKSSGNTKIFRTDNLN